MQVNILKQDKHFPTYQNVPNSHSRKLIANQWASLAKGKKQLPVWHHSPICMCFESSQQYKQLPINSIVAWFNSFRKRRISQFWPQAELIGVKFSCLTRDASEVII